MNVDFRVSVISVRRTPVTLHKKKFNTAACEKLIQNYPVERREGTHTLCGHFLPVPVSIHEDSWGGSQVSSGQGWFLP